MKNFCGFMKKLSQHRRFSLFTLAAILTLSTTAAEVCNLKVVTDASPDYSDIPSHLHSVTAKWPTAKEKCWALFYWNHIARRQTAPMELHGLALTDPIRQFNDYGYTMCSTISGINCALWHNLGLPVKYWDISLHTVPEVFYDGRWHMYDNSMSALYTLCDTSTIAGVEDIGREGACAASGGRSERGHVAKYHCLNATGPNGFLTGADTQRSLDEESRCFNPNGLKYRNYFFDWDYGHRYILNLKEGETFTRYYKSLGEFAEFYVPNQGKDPDSHYRIRGNGVWNFHPDLTSPGNSKEIHSAMNIAFNAAGLHPTKAGEAAEVIFKVQGANVITSEAIRAKFRRKNANDQASLAISVNNGLAWTEVWKADAAIGETQAKVRLLERVNGSYEILIKATLLAKESPLDVSLRDLDVQTTVMLNARTQPKLNLGRNTIYVGAGDQTESTVFWPELAGGKYKDGIVDEKNIVSTPKHIGYQGAIHPATADEDAYLVYRVEAPADCTRVNFGGRFCNRASKSRIDLLYSLDAGKTWTRVWSLRRTTPPWDVIHYETVEIPARHRVVWLKYLMNTPDPSPGGCSIYALRIEGDYLSAGANFKPVQVTFNWSEWQQDRSLVERSHAQTIMNLPFKYAINVAGADHPVMNSLRVNLQGAVPDLKDGYSGGKEVSGEKFVPKKLTLGRNLAIGKRYTLSIPSGNDWGAGDDGKKLTSGAGGPSYAGGTSYHSGALWLQDANPAITLDLGAPMSCASFGMNFHGYPWWDALKGEVQDKVEVLTSSDGKDYTSQGFLKSDLRWVDLPVNYMWPDDESITSATFRFVPTLPVMARYVKYQVTNKRIFDCAGLEVLDSIKSEPFDLRLALPDEEGPAKSLAPADDGSENSGLPSYLR
jgi:hypothetical protein